MAIELRNEIKHACDVTRATVGEFQLGVLADEELRFTGRLPYGPILLPRYPVGPRSQFHEVVALVMNDILNAAGQPHDDSWSFDRNF